ncbi:MAG TPA: DUF885 family protein [Novosphingobium sp.]|nr:DUF885 family protein [Novosphingobium sp.]HZV10334.1 DUF885 family protein [Novosphingobium sp.]
MDRRSMIRGTAAGLAMAGLGGAALAGPEPQGAEGARLAALFDRIAGEMLDRSPETVTSLGLDRGARAGAKARLDDRSLAAWQADKARNGAQLAALQAIDRAALAPRDRANLASVVFQLAVQDRLYRQLPYAGMPYAVSQLTGAYQQIPDFLDSQHSIASAADAEAYLARLAGFATALDQENEQVRHDAALGVVPPAFILATALQQLRALAGQGSDASNLVQSLARRARAQAIAGDWEARAGAVYTGLVRPALARQIALLESLAPRAGAAAGVGHLPQGGALYALSLQYYTTSTMPPAEIHREGLALVARLSGEADAILRRQGLSQGSVGARMRALYARPDQLYPNTEAGKAQLLADLAGLVARVEALLPAWFGARPRAHLAIRRVPREIEAGAPGGYYQPGALDGSRPGAYYINLRDTAEVPRWSLPTLTFHEGIPGHHLQLSLGQEAGLPLIRKMQFFSGYGEGWALYAEQLAVEMGLYAGDPLGHLGQIHDALFRAVRLVVDSGLHAQGWSRARAIAYYRAILGSPQAAAATEVDRYCVWPGQACSYMLGKLEWLRLREKARRALGPRFDIRAFHDAGLLPGAVPLPVLAGEIDAYIAANAA